MINTGFGYGDLAPCSCGRESEERGQMAVEPVRDVPARILDAARELVLEVGVAGTTTRAVAARAAVNQSLVHYHFRSREGLLIAVLEAEDQRLLARQSQMYAEEERLSEAWARACEFFEQDLSSGYVRILAEMWAAGYTNETIAAEVRTRIRGWHELLADVARRHGEPYRLDVDPDVLAAATAALFFGMEIIELLGVPGATERHRDVLRLVWRDLVEREMKSPGPKAR